MTEVFGNHESSPEDTNQIGSPESYGIVGYDQGYVDTIFSQREENSMKNIRQNLKDMKPNEERMIQRNLVNNKYDISYSGMTAKDGVDGQIGPQTIAACRQMINDIKHKKENVMSTKETIRSNITGGLVSLKEKILGSTEDSLSGRINDDVLQEKFSDPVVKETYDYSEEAYYDAPLFTHMGLSDVRGLMRYESYFDQESKSSTGSTGVMQMTSVAFGDFQKNPHMYDKEYLTKIFAAEGLDYGKVRDGLYPKTTTNSKGISYTYYSFKGGSKERKKVFENRNINIALGLSYLKACEKRGTFGGAMRAIKNDSLQIMKRAKAKLKNRGIIVDDEKINQLRRNLKTDNRLQTKFSAFARYNGEKDYGDGITVQDRYVYAMSALYMGQETFF